MICGLASVRTHPFTRSKLFKEPAFSGQHLQGVLTGLTESLTEHDALVVRFL